MERTRGLTTTKESSILLLEDSLHILQDLCILQFLQAANKVPPSCPVLTAFVTPQLEQVQCLLIVFSEGFGIMGERKLRLMFFEGFQIMRERDLAQLCVDLIITNHTVVIPNASLVPRPSHPSVCRLQYQRRGRPGKTKSRGMTHLDVWRSGTFLENSK